MATSTLAAVDIANMALRMLGDDALTPAEFTANTLRRAQIANQFYASVRDATLADHPWNFAMKRSTRFAYEAPMATLTPGAGAMTEGAEGIQFTTSSAIWTTADVGRQIWENSTTPGAATITDFVSSTIVTATIDQAFGSLAAMAEDFWLLYYEYPTWGFEYAVALPDDCLRVWRIEGNPDYRVVGPYIHVDMEQLNVEFIRQETDTTRFTFQFVQALSTHLAAILAEPITGQNAKAELFMKKYQMLLSRAKSLDGQEGTPEVLESNALIDVR
jgi:hypothetical protein